MNTIFAMFHLLLALAAAPFLLSVINRTKAFFGGRVGPPWLQPYYDLWKLLGKGAVYSQTTSWVFRAGPIVSLASITLALMLVPFGSSPALLAFPGDLLLFAYLLGLARLFTVLAAMDTGSAFEGMGASREVQFSALAEPALLLGLATVARAAVTPETLTSLTQGVASTIPLTRLSLSSIHEALTFSVWVKSSLVLALVGVTLLVVMLLENSRIPVDDPNTHLELTMIHEVMVLDHGGPDLAFILYGQALKLWLLGTLVLEMLLPINIGFPPLDTVLSLAVLIVLAVLVGVIESTMARLRLLRIPQMLVGATALAAVAFLLER